MNLPAKVKPYEGDRRNWAVNKEVSHLRPA